MYRGITTDTSFPNCNFEVGYDEETIDINDTCDGLLNVKNAVILSTNHVDHVVRQGVLYIAGEDKNSCSTEDHSLNIPSSFSCIFHKE